MQSNRALHWKQSPSASHNAVPNPAAGDSSDPDLQIRFVAGYALDPDAIQSYIKIGQLQATKQKWPAGVTMQLLTARPKSSGTVGLRSTDPFDLPKVRRQLQYCRCLLRGQSAQYVRCWYAVSVCACVIVCML
jgi:hypothetical protein